MITPKHYPNQDRSTRRRLPRIKQRITLDLFQEAEPREDGEPDDEILQVDFLSLLFEFFRLVHPLLALLFFLLLDVGELVQFESVEEFLEEGLVGEVVLVEDLLEVLGLLGMCTSLIILP